jgi:hypothetical protein
MKLVSLCRTIAGAVVLVSLLTGESRRAGGAIFPTNWSRSGTTQYYTSAPLIMFGWTLRTQDTDENAGFLSLSLPPLAVSPGDHFTIVMDGFDPAGHNVVDASSYPPGSVITRAPHDLDAGTWAYAMALYDQTNAIQSFFQIRAAGSSATAGGATPTLASAAVAAGLWPSVDAYIEFQGSAAYYQAMGFPGSPPTGPGSYVGFAFPEPTGLTMLCSAGAGLAARRRPKSRATADA